MTKHYYEKTLEDLKKMKARSIIEGWKYHGNDMPVAFGTFSLGDNIAYICWKYLSWIKAKKDREIMSIEEYCKNLDEYKEITIMLLTEAVEIARKENLLGD